MAEATRSQQTHCSTKGAGSHGQQHVCSSIGRPPALSTIMVPAQGCRLSQARLTCMLGGSGGGGGLSDFLTFVVRCLALCLMNAEHKNER